MKNFVRFLAVIASWLSVQVAVAQVISVPAADAMDDPARQEALRTAAERAKQTALTQMRQLGGRAALAAEKLQRLQAPQFLERLAVQPIVGPSTTAAPPAAGSTPTPSVNWSVGGGPTTGHPGVALLLARRSGENEFSPTCTGTLVSQNVVLTAAHCICWSRYPDENYVNGEVCTGGDAARAPSPLLDPANWRVFFQHAGLREVVQVISDEQYQFEDSRVRNDLALLVLSEPVRDINPARLPVAANPASPWQNGEIIGFGFSAISQEGDAPKGGTVLEQLTWPGLKSRGEVKSSGCELQKYLDPAGSLCSLFAPRSGGSTATVCSGDSGGPLRLFDASGTAIGVTSGRNDDNCASGGTVSFQMATSYSTHRAWIERHLNTVAIATVAGRWPAFGENLRDVIQRRNGAAFGEDGRYLSEGWMQEAGGRKVLATINSSGPINVFEVQNRQGKPLCRGQAGAGKHLRNVDYCVATIPLGDQYRIVATGKPNELLQYVVTKQAAR